MSNPTIKKFIYVLITFVMISISRVYASVEQNKNNEIQSVNMKALPTAAIIESNLIIQKEVNLPKELEATKNAGIKNSDPVLVNGKQYTKEEIKAKICAVFGNECVNALIIAERESGFRANAISKTNDYGIFQLNCKWHRKRVRGNCNLFLNADVNIKIAKQIYDEQGWSPWTTKIFLPK